MDTTSSGKHVPLPSRPWVIPYPFSNPSQVNPSLSCCKFNNLFYFPMSGLEPTCNLCIMNHWFSIPLHSVDFEVWSKLAECARDFDCEWERVNTFFHCVTNLLWDAFKLWQIISYSDTNVPVLVVMEYKRASVLYLYEILVLLHTSRSTEYTPAVQSPVNQSMFYKRWQCIGHEVMALYCNIACTVVMQQRHCF